MGVTITDVFHLKSAFRCSKSQNRLRGTMSDFEDRNGTFLIRAAVFQESATGRGLFGETDAYTNRQTFKRNGKMNYETVNGALVGIEAG